MNCAETKELLSPYYDGELSDELAGDVKRHVGHCPACEAELASFQQLSAVVGSVQTPLPAEGNWQRIAARLEQSSPQLASAGDAPSMIAPTSGAVASPSKVGLSEFGPSKFGGGRAVAAALLALAASLLLVVGLRARMGGTERHASPAVALAVDYQDILRTFEREPRLAMEKLSKRYEGREVSAEQAEALLGYRPSIAAGLPSQTRLVSTRVLKLPQCKCAGGKCTCGPGECNCAACLCERPDGSKFLVFEQCKTQDVTFGNLPFVIAKRNLGNVQFVKSNEQLAVSWVKDNRRLTAIGLKDEAEAESLIAALGGQHS